MVDFDVKAMIKRIESVLTEKGMSKEDFYAKSKVSSASFSQWKTGTHKPTPKKIFAIAQCLGVSVEFLTGENQKEKSPAPEGAELTSDQIKAIEKIKKMPPEELARKMAALEAVLDM